MPSITIMFGEMTPVDKYEQSEDGKTLSDYIIQDKMDKQSESQFGQVQELLLQGGALAPPLPPQGCDGLCQIPTPGGGARTRRARSPERGRGELLRGARRWGDWEPRHRPC